MIKYFAFALIFTMVYFHFGGVKALVIGDSLSCYKNGWQDVVGTKTSYKIYNISKGGKRTDWMLKELKSKLDSTEITRVGFDKVYIYGGINDMFSGVKSDVAVRNIQEMVNLCLQNKTKPVVIVGYDPNRVNVDIKNYKSSVEKSGRNNYIQFQKELLNIKGAKIIPMDTTVTRKDSDDGIHLNAEGHRKFSKWVLEHE